MSFDGRAYSPALANCATVGIGFWGSSGPVNDSQSRFQDCLWHSEINRVYFFLSSPHYFSFSLSFFSPVSVFCLSHSIYFSVCLPSFHLHHQWLANHYLAQLLSLTIVSLNIAVAQKGAEGQGYLVFLEHRRCLGGDLSLQLLS